MLNFFMIIAKRIHTGSKSYECFICKNTSPFSRTLVRHKRIHTGKKLYTLKMAGHLNMKKRVNKESSSNLETFVDYDGIFGQFLKILTQKNLSIHLFISD